MLMTSCTPYPCKSLVIFHFFKLYSRVRTFIKEIFWKATLPEPTTTEEAEIYKKLPTYKGSDFDDIFVKDHVEYRVALEIFKFFLLHARVSITLYIISI